MLSSRVGSTVGAFGDDVAFLRKYTDVIVLRDRAGDAQIAVVPAWQGRVMTSAAAHDSLSFGWIHRDLIASRKIQPHINAFGGEDRLWLGPEAGQFGLFFAPGVKFDLDHWFVPQALDTRPFEVTARSSDKATFQAQFSLANWSGTHFEVALQREVRVLEPRAAWAALGTNPLREVALVSYESINTLTNAGQEPWKRSTGLLSLWILGMFNPSPSATIIAPIRQGSDTDYGPKVLSDYFGDVPPNRLKVTDRTIFFSGDGRFRSKIGINPKRSLGKLGSYDAEHRVLSIVLFDQPQGATEYVNSLWKIQNDPYAGDAANSYNDGPASPGAKPLGPFFELESSSPAAALAPREHLTHTHRTFHLTGPQEELDVVAREVLGVSLTEIQAALTNH